MSASHERSALEHPDSLFDHITRLHLRSPDTPLHEDDAPFLDVIRAQLREDDSRSYEEQRDALVAALKPFFTDPDALPDRLHEALIQPEITTGSLSFTSFPFEGVDPPTPDRARELGVWLARNGSDVRAVLVGLVLLEKSATPAEIPLLRTVGLLSCFTDRCAAILGGLPGAAFDLVWMADRTSPREVWRVVDALCEQADPFARQWLLRNAFGTDGPGSNARARRIAEVSRLADALTEEGRDDALLDQAIAIMVRMTSHRDYRTEIEKYSDSMRVLTLLAAEMPLLAPTLDRFAGLVALMEDMRTGAAACLVWAAGERAAVLDHMSTALYAPAWQRILSEALRNPDPFVSWRARWVRAHLDSPTDIPDPPSMREGRSHFEIRIIAPVAPGPGILGNAETRVLIDGRPIIAVAFPDGDGEPPEYLLFNRALRATEEPREVRLAEAYCTEGCCGALYVTIVREGDEVVWRDWKTSYTAETPPEYRFSATEYDREVTRAEQDHDWEWPARTLGRLILAELRADPTILRRWNCSISWIMAWAEDLDLTCVYLLAEGKPFPHQFGFRLKADPANLETQARDLIDAFRNTYPGAVSESFGGTTAPIDL